MKKLLAGICTVALMLGVVACGEAPATSSTTESSAAATLADLEGKRLAVPATPMSQEDLEKTASSLKLAKIDVAQNVLDSLMMVLNDRADACVVPTVATAKYFIGVHPDLQYVANPVENGFSMVLAKSNTALQEELNSAIEKLEKDGMLKSLKETWIENFDEKTLVAEKIPSIAGAQTIKMGISGDAVPLDYIMTDGSPAGFNVAMMTEISKILNKNVEFVAIGNETKFAAIESGRIDAFFLHSELSTVPDTMVRTTNYHTEASAFILKK